MSLFAILNLNIRNPIAKIFWYDNNNHQQTRQLSSIIFLNYPSCQIPNYKRFQKGVKQMKKLNVAIIGQGRSGRDIHGSYFHKDTERFHVVAIVDALERRRIRAKEEFGCDVYETYQELFGRTDIDFVVNSTFSYMHPDITIDLLNHGFHVLVEKPAAQTEAQVEKMMEASKKNNRMLAVFQ